MKTKDAINIVRFYAGYVPNEKFAEIFSITTGALDKRFQREQELKDDEAWLLAEKFNLPSKLFFNAADLPKTFRIPYYENNKIRLERNPNMKYYYMDFEIAYKYRKSAGPSDFKIICMIGNKLNGGLLWIKDGDVLLLDVTYKDCSSPGLYAYECDNGEYVAMAYIEKHMNNEYVFKYADGSPDRIRTQEFLDKAKFRIIGRVLKNLFFYA